MSTIRLQTDRESLDASLLREDLKDAIARWTSTPGEAAKAIPWLTLYRQTEQRDPCLFVYDPCLAVILQGRKRVEVGDESFVYGESDFFLSAIDLPVTAHVIDASEERPYLSLRIQLDLAEVRQMILDHDLPAPKVAPIQRGMATSPLTSEVLCACARLVDLLDTPRHIPVLSALLRKELAYHLLSGEGGGRLWQIAMTGSQSNRIHQVIQHVRHHFTAPLRMDELADMAAMSVSSMHHHFREITSMSPLQFQKQLRLHEARRLMLVEDVDAGMAALRVGYESASQFSREYSRLFGQPPMRDIKQLRALPPSAS